MFTQLFITAAVMGLFMTSWYLLQCWVRRHSPEVPPDGDILEGKWGCRGCLFRDRCEQEPECREVTTP